jgi:hypothetical protein
MIASTDSSFRKTIMDSVRAKKIPSLDLVFSFMEIYGIYCLGYIYRHEKQSVKEDFCRFIRKTLKSLYPT